MRNVTVEGLHSLLAEATGMVWIFGISFHANENDPEPFAPLYLCSDMRNLTYAGASGDILPANTEFIGYPFEVTLAADNEESVPQAKIKIDNVSREFTAVIRSTKFAPEINLYVFRIKNNPDDTYEMHLEMGPSSFTLLSASGNAVTVEGTIGYENDILNEPATQHYLTPTQAPAIFG